MFKVLFISVSSSTTLFAWKVIEVSSANSTKLPRDLIFNISFINIKNNNGPRTEP